MYRNKSILSLILFFFLFLSGCTDTKNQNSSDDLPFEKEVFALDTYIDLKIYDNNAEQTANLAEEKIIELEKLFSVTDPTSDVSRINYGSGEWITVSSETIDVIKKSINVSEITDGSMDISVYPIVRLWGFTTESNQVPEQNLLDEALKKVNFKDIEIDEKEHSVRLKPGMQLDLGAVAKGYISEQVKDLMKTNGIESAVLSFGGNIQTIGTKNGEPWKVGIRYPFTQNTFAILNVTEKAVVTSATDQRYFEDNGKMYHHIIDPETGYPSENGTKSVTVISESGTEADEFSTALFVMGTNKAKDFYKNEKCNFEFIILDDNDTVIVSEGLKDVFRLSSDYDFLKVGYAEK